MSAYATAIGKVPSKRDHGEHFVQTYFDRGPAFGRSLNKTLVTMDDIHNVSYTMFMPGLIEEDGKIKVILYLIVPPCENNPYKSAGDIVALEKFESITEGDQTHLNDRVVAGKDGIKIRSNKGKTHLGTETYTVTSESKNSKTIREVPMPQQLLIAQDGGAIDVSGYENLSREGTGMIADGNILQSSDIGLVKKATVVLQQSVESQQVKNSGAFSKTTTTEKSVTHSSLSCFDETKQSLIIKGAQGIHQTASKDVAGIEAIYDSPDTQISSVIKANSFESSSETNSSFSDQKTSKSQQTPFVDRSIISAPITRFKGKATGRGLLITGHKIIDETDDGLFLGQQKQEMLYSQEMSNETAMSSSKVWCRGGYEVGVPSELLVDVIERSIETGEIKLESVLLDKDKTQIIGKFKETIEELRRWQESGAEHSQVIPNEAMVVVALGIALATQGAGATWAQGLLTSTFGTVPTITTAGTIAMVPAVSLTATGAAMASAGLTALCTQAGTSFLRTGDPITTAKEVFSPESLKSIGISIASAGLFQNIGSALGVDMNLGLTALADPQKQVLFTDFLKANALKSIIDTPLQSVIGGVPVEDAFEEGLKSLGVNTVASYASYHIGRIYSDPNKPMGYFEHKGLHGGLGAISGWLFNPTSKGLVGGAIGGFVSEIVMDERREIVKEKAIDVIAKAEKEGRSLKDGKFQLELYNALSSELAFAKLSGATVAALLNQDVFVASQTATNAVENNAIMLAIGVGLAAYEVYEVIKIAQEEGPKAALQKIAVDGTIVIVTAGAGKVIYEVGKLSAPMAEMVWATYIAQNPAFTQVVNKVFAPLGKGISKAKEFYHKVDDSLERGVEKISSKFSSFTRNELGSGKGLGKSNPTLPKNRELLHDQLASEQLLNQEGHIIAGKGGEKAFKNEGRIVSDYGGEIGDWVKKSSNLGVTSDGRKFEIHWVENIKTGRKVEPKTVFPGNESISK